jgi:hypothetical protein
MSIMRAEVGPMSEIERAPMTNWYDPRQLIDTANRTIISTTVGKYADPRSGSADPTLGSYFDYTTHLIPSKYDFQEDKSKGPRDEIWIDYAADVGDGFNSTYAVAYHLAQPTLEINGQSLHRGEILFFGGDGVYPTANTKRYAAQLEWPYRMAYRAGKAAGAPPSNSELATQPHILALPGNHDWYDSLVAFRQLFCSHMFNDRKFAAEDDDARTGGWHTRQRRSYFTLKLPQNWWLLAVDMQLSHNIDVPQLHYFESIIEEKMKSGDKVIVCVPEPYWTNYIKYQDVTDLYEEKERSIEKLHRLFDDNGVQVKAFIAGDLHHYRRFEDSNGVQKITAGGGGAFLHPTHDYKFARKIDEMKKDEKKSYKGFRLAGEYPQYDVSKGLDWGNFKFIFNNKTFGIMTAAIYFVLALMVHGDLRDDHGNITYTEFSWYGALKATIDRIINEPIVIVIIALLLLGLIFFTDSNSKWYKRIAGFIHGLSHLAGAFFFGWLGYLVGIWVSNQLHVPIPSTRYNVIWFLSVLVTAGLGGYILGSIIMGIYLLISLRVFKRHSNEAFSAMKIEDYKNFLRLHIDREGVLTIYPIKIDKVPRNWKKEGDYLRPSDGSKPALIESEPIVVA